MDQDSLNFELHKYGNIDGAEGVLTFDELCPNVGPIFNPLAEYIWWDQVLNPFADPTRGTISDVTVVESDKDADGTFTWTQAKFLQNLAGKDSIIGKSIKYRLSGTGPDAMGCCVIGADVPPQAPAEVEQAH